MRELIWQAIAREDAAGIIATIAERDPAAARRLRDRFDAVVRPLPEHPWLYRPGRVPGTRELVAHPTYILVYVVTDATVEIVRVLHVQRQYP